ncbi:MAG TPA: hypothetical protein VF533_08445 [Solirubrobacteraceae bacterium]|jgi:hypothetical protein
MFLRGLTAIATLAALLVVAEPAAAGSWVEQSVPAKQGFNGRSAALSCPTATFCMAVGSSLDPKGQQRALAQAWNGSSWTLKPLPVPAGVNRTRLAGVSCTAADACTAVGHYDVPEGTPPFVGVNERPFVVRWNGTSWTQQTVPLPSGSTLAHLNAVSCTAAAGCKAVGAYRTSSTKSATLIAHWGGSAWTVRASPNTGHQYNTLHGISCVGARCIAVGATGDNPSTPTGTMAVRYDGTAWSPLPLPGPASAASALMTGVSCTTATACTAVGGYSAQSSEPDTLVIARWNGTSWTPQTPPQKENGVFRQQLDAVSCTGASLCTAAGFETNAYAGGDNPLVLRWNGASWEKQTAPEPAGVDDGAWLGGISCNSAGCTTVGGASVFGYANAGSVALAERRATTATSWTLQSAANRTGAYSGDMFGVSCVSATWCLGVGTYTGGRGQGATIARWNGTAWASQTPGAAIGTGRGGDNLNAVSCTSTTACMAVGTYEEPGGGIFAPARPLAQRYNGTSWTSQKLPFPADAGSIQSMSVACGSATACFAVGQFQSGPYLARWNGTAWSQQTVPAPAGTVPATLRGVACTSASACTAVGRSSSSTGQKPLIVRWNGTSWAYQPAVAPAGATYVELTGVSCTAPKPCTAVGSYSGPNGAGAFAERWTGTTWTLQSVPYAGLKRVSCPTLTSCTGVGGYTPSQEWNGTSWSLKGQDPATFQWDVSCTAASDCTSSGWVERRENVIRSFFAGVVLMTYGKSPTAARFSEAKAAASAPGSSDRRVAEIVAR